jgi:hypothetical protein
MPCLLWAHDILSATPCRYKLRFTPLFPLTLFRLCRRTDSLQMTQATWCETFQIPSSSVRPCPFQLMNVRTNEAVRGFEEKKFANLGCG